MNYVIQVNDDDFPSKMIEKLTNELSEQEYQNVFALKISVTFQKALMRRFFQFCN